MKTQEEVDKYAATIATDLYYDLLEKYVALQADHKALRKSHKLIQCELLVYKEYCSIEPSVIAGSWNKRLEMIIRIIHKHKTNYKDLLNDVNNLKIISK